MTEPLLLPIVIKTNYCISVFIIIEPFVFMVVFTNFVAPFTFYIGKKKP